MRRLVLPILFAGFLSVLGFPARDVSAGEMPRPLDARVQAALETIDSDDIYTYIAYLASNSLKGRNAGTEGNDRAADWIGEFFADLGLCGGACGKSYFQPFEFSARGMRGEKVMTRNVIACWRGSDPLLRDEVVIIGAHFDHVGMHGQKSNPWRLGKPSRGDLVWNGADDNASGTSAVLEIAQAFALSRVPTRRSIVFICFSAEEHGLYGSRHYVENPSFPLDDTAAMLNLDMIGRNPTLPVLVFGLASDQDGFARDALQNLAHPWCDGVEFRSSGGGFGGSDHWPFLREGVPAFFFFTGFHRDYHMNSDEVEKIATEHVQKIACSIFLLAYEIANRENRLVFNTAWGHKINSKRKTLGIDSSGKVPSSRLEGLGLPEDQGAFRVAGVYSDTVASRAGLRPGDLILRLGTVTILAKDPSDSLREAIKSAPCGTAIPLIILRGREIITLEAEWLAKDSDQDVVEDP